jgi:hypothetical protein
MNGHVTLKCILLCQPRWLRFEIGSVRSPKINPAQRLLGKLSAVHFSAGNMYDLHWKTQLLEHEQ